MNWQISPRVSGATVIGLALVFGAYIINNFSSIGERPTNPQTAAVKAGVQRVAIPVQDADKNGIEDWRDAFVTAEPVLVDRNQTTPYTEPDTLTGKMSLSFFQSILTARTQGPFGRSNEQVIGDTLKAVSQETEAKLYDTPDISIMKNWDDADIVNYANTIAGVIKEYNIQSDNELIVINDIVAHGATERMGELKALAAMYKMYRDETIATPVPAFLAKPHLDLINTYTAIYEDIIGMTKFESDPAFSLLRLKRYPDDADGLRYALQNMYKALEPHAALFTANDPAVLFLLFSPNYQM